MLDGRAEAGAKKRNEDHPEPARVAQRHECRSGDEGSEREEIAFAEALGEESRRNLKSRHGRAVCRPDQSDLRQCQTERLREQRQQHVSDV
jgi:endonuclease III